jgi:predicted O-methyltransferase YrrM
LEKKKYQLALNLFKKHKNLVISGPYRNMFFSEKSHWGTGDIGPKIIGIYELEVQIKLLELINNFKIENFVNIGSSEGYHAIGIVKKKNIKNLIVFEKDERSIELLKENIKKNELKTNITIEAEANLDSLNKLNNKIDFSKTLFLIDIEGYELELINDKSIELLKKSFLIIENHNFLLSDEKQDRYRELINKLKDKFNLEIIKNTGRDISQINEISNLSENEQMMIISEGRIKMMEWLVLTSKR